MSECSKGWDKRCAASTGKRCRCRCGGSNHGKNKPGDKVQTKLELGPVEFYDNTEAYYTAVPEARHSGESDYGVWWKDSLGMSWRLSYVHATGHLYIVPASRLDQGGPLIVLATAPKFDRTKEGMLVADPAEKILEGWGDACGKPDSLSWVYDRLGRTHGITTEEFVERVRREKEGELAGVGETEAGQESQQVTEGQTA